jgi:hypothetical protein
MASSSDARTSGCAPTPTCRRVGCSRPLASAAGFCAECQRAYECARDDREQALLAAGERLARCNRNAVGRAPEWPRHLLLRRAAAHNADRGRISDGGICMAVVKDFLPAAMERVAAERKAGA